MRVVLIANPRSGRNRGLLLASMAADILTNHGWTVNIEPTTAPGDAVRLAREAAEQNYDLVFACGGDGTFSQVVIGLMDTGVPAGLIPAGTGNDFARAVGLSRNPNAAAHQALMGEAKAIDLLEVNDGETWAINVLGVGFDAAVATRINQRIRLTDGAFAYVTAVLQELMVYRPTEVEFGVDGEVWAGCALLVAIANAQCYGGGMRIAPGASLTDGLLDVVLVREISKCGFLQAFPRVFRGSHLNHPAVSLWQGREVKLQTAIPCSILLDGDLWGTTPVKIRVVPGKGLIWLPRD